MKNVTEEGQANYREILERTHSLKKAPKKIKPLAHIDFDVMGDSRTDYAIAAKTITAICADHASMVLHTGDIVENGEDNSQWQRLLGDYSCLLKQNHFYPACGNHEGNRCVNNVFRETLGNTQRYYSEELNGFTFLILDSITVDAKELQWLSQLPPGKFYIPVLHYAAYPLIAGHPGEPLIQKEFVPRFKKLGVRLVLNGHNHGYDRNTVDGITYVTTGGAGAPLYPCGPFTPKKGQVCDSTYHYLQCALHQSAVTCVAKQLDGTLLDRFSIDYRYGKSKR